MHLFLFAIIFLFPYVAQAHGDTASFETTVEDYLIDIGYSTENPTVEDVILFDFNITQEDNKVLFSDVWVKIEDSAQAVVFATGVHNATFGGPRLSYMFPEAGTYTISVRFEDENGSRAETSFPLTVRDVESFPSGNYLYGLAGLIIGAVAVWITRRRKPM